jgi:hypothetical protein
VDNLASFLNDAQNNCVKFQTEYKPQFEFLERIDSIFHDTQLFKYESSQILTCSFQNRSWMAYRASARVLLSGQVVESHSLIRACIECAAYAHFLTRKPELRKIWAERGNSEEATSKVRSEFRWGAIRKLIATENAELGAELHQIYEECVSNGAHPNVEGHAMHFEISNENMKANTFLVKELVWFVAIQRLRDAGLVALEIFELILDAQFRSTQLGSKLRDLVSERDKVKSQSGNAFGSVLLGDNPT